MIKKKKRILVIEDEKVLLEIAKNKLEHEGFEVVAKETAEDAFDILINDGISFVWLDLLLPKMQGLEFLQKLRDSKSKCKNTPVMIVSNFDDNDKVKKAFELNVVDYKVKAKTDINKIVKEIGNYLNK